MRNYFIHILLAFAMLFVSCEDEDKSPFDRITNNLGTAGGLRTINLFSSSLNLSDLENSSFQVEVEAWDNEDGGLLESVEVFARLQDNSSGNGDSSTPETLISTISASAFSPNGDSGLPRTVINVLASEVVASLGLDPQADLDGGDVMRFRLALNLSDGTVFSSGNLEGNVTGAFFNSPFSYPLTFICIPPAPITGDWSIDMQDSFGDGWNNAAIRVTADGTATDYTFETGSTASFVVSIPDGTETLSWEFVSGAFDSEVTFQIFAPSGNLVANLGPSPAVGEIALNLCNE